MCLEGLTETMREAMKSSELEYEHDTIADTIQVDIKAILD